MNKSEKEKNLLRDYFNGKLSDNDVENLFSLINREDFKEVVFSQQYHVWNESPNHNKRVRSAEIFERIRREAKITDGMLAEGDLLLKGYKYDQLHSHRTKLYAVLKYAAVILITMFFSGIAYHITKRNNAQETAQTEITVPYGSKIQITLGDSSRVWLNSGSTLRYPNHFAESSREVHLEGEAFFDIRKNPDQPFYVRTADIDIKVLGTRFNVKSYSEEDIIETTLVSGQLLVEAKRNSTSKGIKTLLSPNQKVYYSKTIRKLRLEDLASTKDKEPKTKTTSNQVNIETQEQIKHLIAETSWTENLLIFRDEPFSSLSKKLERWYNVEITICNAEIGDYKFTGSIKNETITKAMDAFSFASGFDYSIDHNKIEISKKQ